MLIKLHRPLWQITNKHLAVAGFIRSRIKNSSVPYIFQPGLPCREGRIVIELMIDSKDFVDKGASALLKILVYGKEQGFVLLTIQDYAKSIKLVTILIYCLNAFDTIEIFAIKYSGKCWTTLLYFRVLHGRVLDAVEVVMPVSCENQLVLGSVL